MTGWLILIVLAGMTLAGLTLPRAAPRAALEVVIAALLLALAGYAWQGNPGMPGHPVTAASAG